MFCDIQIVIIANFVVVLSVCIKRVDCISVTWLNACPTENQKAVGLTLARSETLVEI